MNGTVTVKKTPILKKLLLFAVGAFGYYFIEVVFRGYSHWSMGVCGGICLLEIYAINSRHASLPCTFRALMCAAFITFVEFVAGCLLNLWLGLGIWDYSKLPYNILGQVSLLFFCVWFYLSFAVCFIISLIEKHRPKAAFIKK